MQTASFRIISGAQTGVDRAALDAALVLHVPCSGWVPAGRIDEQGVIPEHYPVKELQKGGYRQRTLQNLMDADATVIIYSRELEGGTEQTLLSTIKLHRPYHLIDADAIPTSRATERIFDFVIQSQCRSLNVAGPRASKWEGGYAYTFEVITHLLNRLQLSQVSLG